MLFGIFSKKAKLEQKKLIDESLIRSAEMLKIQLMLCDVGTDEYNKFIKSTSFSGYVCGFFDATVQHIGVERPADRQITALITAGFYYLFQGDHEKTLHHTKIFLDRQDDDEYCKHRGIGGNEYLSFMRGEIEIPNGLARMFHEFCAIDH
ncbi:hypothetical protein GCM10009108_26530 [Castellaniella ginsengisoli]|uniref:Uncharacterized protein n=1 Tax=Castellaniella ginsengisoli TaxID=546114 RepID=A0ABN1L1U8_9BURK